MTKAIAVARFKNVTKQFHDLVAVNGINLKLYEGEILGFVGARIGEGE